VTSAFVRRFLVGDSNTGVATTVRLGLRVFLAGDALSSKSLVGVLGEVPGDMRTVGVTTCNVRSEVLTYELRYPCNHNHLALS
jgi:hypothetical protein